ncbi:hypothetical protein [Bifidobacterium thermophilum]|uniref:hypothetical protein n=1 Tax=Bifidobacterium thermophilum TaxID=33905 RepID=UPI003F917A64
MNIKTKQVTVWYTLTLGTKFTVNVPEGLEGDAVELYIQANWDKLIEPHIDTDDLETVDSDFEIDE